MITKKSLKEQLIKLQTNYGTDKFDLSQEKFDLWYEMIGECDERILEAAVKNCIKENEYPPTIATLMKFYREVEAAREEIHTLMKTEYSNMRSYWGERYDSETFRAIIEYVFRYPKDQRKAEMVSLTHRAVSYYNNCIYSGKEKIMSIKEYVESER